MPLQPLHLIGLNGYPLLFRVPGDITPLIHSHPLTITHSLSSPPDPYPLSREGGGRVDGDGNPAERLGGLLFPLLGALQRETDQGTSAALLDHRAAQVLVAAQCVKHPGMEEMNGHWDWEW